MKTRRVLRKFTVKDGVFLCEGLGYGNLGGVRAYLPDGTKAEIAIYEDVPSKRELVVPENAVWQRDLLTSCNVTWCLSHGTANICGKVIQPRCNNERWHAVVFKKDGNHEHLLCESECGAKQFIYQRLADTNVAGFSWKEPEPDWSRYEVLTLWYVANNHWVHFRTAHASPNKIMQELFLEPFETLKKQRYDAVLLEGRLPDDSVEIIVRWPEEEKGN